MDEKITELEDESLTAEIVKKKSIKGIIVLTFRTFVLQLIALAAMFLLTIFLSPEEYGVFFVVSALINIFAYFSDIGFAAALIQKKESLTESELKATFTIQQILVFSLLVLVFILTPFLKSFYNLADSSVYLLWALAFSLLLSSFKTIPSILLERKLDFQKLIIPQIGETLVFNLVAVFLAWKGFGATSYTIAVLARGFVGLILMYLVQPWKPGIYFSKKTISPLFKYGLPYQTNTFLALIKDDSMTAFLGLIIGPGGVGLLGWAQKWSSAPLRFFMDQVIKVTFPAFSRLQDDRQELSRAVSKSLFFICLVVFPSLVFLIVLSPIMTQLVPKYEKWQSVLLPLAILCINSAFAAVTTPLTNLLNAIGKIKTTFKLMIMWTVLTWVVIPIMTLLFGILGAAIGFAIVGASSIVALKIVSQIIPINFLDSVIKPLFAALGTLGTLFLIATILPISWLGVISLIIFGSMIYIGLIILICGTKVLIDIKFLLHSMKKAF